MKGKMITLISAAVLCGALTGCAGGSSSELQSVAETQGTQSATETEKPETERTVASLETQTETEPAETEPVTVTHETPQEVIQELILYYGNYGAEAEAKVRALLRELREMDSRQGALWTEIMDYWEYANHSLPVHVGAEELPDSLPKDNTLAFAVLGFELNDDGTMQDELTGRLELALECAARYPEAYVICTGGGTARNNPGITEGGLMGEWMRGHGLAEERLIVEDKSRTTAENAENSYDIILRDYPQVDSIVLISSSYHIPWGALLFESAFLRSASEKQTPEIHVISNCSCPITNNKYLASEIMRWETGGMLQMIGNDRLAMQYYFDYAHVSKPPLG